MGISYSVDVTLDLSYTEEEVKHVLIRGMEEGCVYFNDYLFQRFLLIDDAVQKSLYADSEDDTRHILTKFQDTSFFIWFFKSDKDKLIFSIGSFGYQWDRDFSNGNRTYTIDFARYIHLILRICGDVTIAALSTDSDATEDLKDDYVNCVVAMLDMGFFGEKKSGHRDEGKLSINSFVSNALQNGFIFFNELFDKQIEPSIQKYYEILQAEFPIHLYAKKNDVLFKIEIKRSMDGWDFASIYPLEPYRMKKGCGSEEEKIDVAFYVQRLLELCENFAIYELKTFF